MTNQEPMIQAEGLYYAYETEQNAPLPIFEGLDFVVHKGEFLAVLGHNGSGKSTLAKCFNGILVPDRGRVLVEDLDTAVEETLYDLRRKVGMVFQNPDNQIVATQVEEDVAFAPENLGIEPKEIRRRVDEALEAVGMSHEKLSAPHNLSGGQKQRVAIAGIIAMRPDCIVMDEPTAMLDPRGRREVISCIEMLRKEYGITVVLITHYMDEAAKADRIAVMDDGKILMEGTPKEVFRNVARLKELGLDVPQATELAHLLREQGADLPDDLLSEEEFVEAFSKLVSPGKEQTTQPMPSLLDPEEIAPSEIALRSEDLSYVYTQGGILKKPALQNVSFSVKKGSMIGLIGHTGSGKSTLVQQFNGLLKPTSGKMLVGESDIWADPKKLRAFRFRVGVVFQYPEYQLFEETVAKDIAFGPKNMGLSEEEIKRRVETAAKRVGLTNELLAKSPMDLSGGEKRRAAIAGIMAMEPEILVLDEPTAGLDPKGREAILSDIRRYQKESQSTVILVSHSMEDIARFTDRVLVLESGNLVADCPTRSIFSAAELLERIGLSLPQVTKIFERLQKMGYPLPSNVLSCQEGADLLKPLLGL